MKMGVLPRFDLSFNNLVGRMTSGGTQTTWDKTTRKHIGRTILCFVSCLLMTVSGIGALYFVSTGPTVGVTEMVAIAVAMLYTGLSYRVSATCLRWRMYVADHEHHLWMRRLNYDKKAKCFPDKGCKTAFLSEILPACKRKQRSAKRIRLLDKAFALTIGATMLSSAFMTTVKVAIQDATLDLPTAVLALGFHFGIQISSALTLFLAGAIFLSFAKTFSRDLRIMVGKH